MRQYNGFVTRSLNASAIKKRQDVFKGNSGLIQFVTNLNFDIKAKSWENIAGTGRQILDNNWYHITFV